MRNLSGVSGDSESKRERESKSEKLKKLSNDSIRIFQPTLDAIRVWIVQI